MKIILDLQNAVDSEQLPEFKKIKCWVSMALKKAKAKFKQPEITIRIVSLVESQQLNLQYRSKDKPTNVLSFPFEAPEMIPLDEIGEFLGDVLGDIVICEDILIQEAEQQNKSPESHWAHIIIHGVLHLLGFDHIDTKEAQEMESLEIEVLTDLGFNDPY